MAAWRQAIELSLGDEDVAELRTIAQARTEPASRVERARILLAYGEYPSFFAVGRALGLHHQTVQRCVERAVVEGPMAALEDRPRPGREPSITLEAKTWLVSLACRKALVPLPSKSPELNPVENIWQYMRDNWLSNRIFANYEDILDHCCFNWNKLVERRWLIMSIGTRR